MNNPHVDLDKLDDISRQKMMSFYNPQKLMGAFTVKVKRVDNERGQRATYPVFKTIGSSGADISSAEDVVIPPHGRALVKTGLIFECPNIRWEVQIRSRSGLALKEGLFVLNSPGTIDSDYRGEVGVILFNTTDTPYHVKPGDRIAQAVICKQQAIVFEPTGGELSATERGSGGFGSTGV